MRLLLPIVAMSSSLATAEETLPPLSADRGPEEIVVLENKEELFVYGDAFKRWDGTRWYVNTQVGFPMPYPLYAENNAMTEAVAVELKLVLACEKTWRRGDKAYEVDCHVEDVALLAASWLPFDGKATPVLLEFDDALTGQKLALVVADDGRLKAINLVGLDTSNERLKAQREQARQLLVRAMAGFHMKLPPKNQIREGQWVEYQSPLFSIPWVEQQTAQQTLDTQRAPRIYNSIGGSYILHQLDRWLGKLFVQSVGEGTTLVGQSDDTESTFKMDVQGVALYDERSGFMTERVWSIQGRSTASSWLSDGRMDATYFHSGRMRMLGETEKVAIGATQLVSPPGRPQAGLPAWKALE